MNIRATANLSPNYYEINREERNYTAILFAALCKPGNAESFLNRFGFEAKTGTDFGIYFEYAYLRDLWNKIETEAVKKEIIRRHLKINGIDAILSLPVADINAKFGVAGSPSKDFVQSPGRWAIVKYNKNFPDNEDFLKICRFKWSFNIKPDIVIHLDKERAICIEAKYESGEGYYPSSKDDKKIFRERGISDVGQMELQKYMMETLLGVRTDFVTLVFKKKKSETHKVISWAEAFGCLDLSEMPFFTAEMVGRISAQPVVASVMK
jgi:hypothetical protein